MSETPKYRREKSDLPSMPKYSMAMLVIAVLQILLIVFVYLNESLGEIFWVPAGLAAIVLSVLAGFAWHNTPLMRRVVRIVLIAVPALMGGIGLVTGVLGAVNDPTEASYNFTLFSSLGLLWVQLITSFMTPVLLVAASFGGRFDRVLLGVFQVITAALTPYFLYYTASAVSVPAVYAEEPMMQLVTMLLSVVFAVLVCLPAVAGNPERRILPEQ